MNQNSQKKKLTLKERLALKKQKQKQAKEQQQKEQKVEKEDEDPQLSGEDFKQQQEEFKIEIWKTYNTYKERYNEIEKQLKKYESKDKSSLTSEEKQDFIYYSACRESFGNVSPERWQVFMKIFSKEDLMEIAENNKLVTKYMIMTEVQKKVESAGLKNYNVWETQYLEAVKMIDKILGFETDESAFMLEKLLGKKFEKKQKVVVVEDESIQFKPIVWSKEQQVDLVQLLEAPSKELLVYDQTKEPLVTIFIGHVDSGKSTICGQILYQTGQVNELEVKKLKEEAEKLNRMSWWAAYILDLNQEERNKGKTVEMGRANFDTDKKRLTILDCPGHKNYVQNMIDGAAQADIACLVVSARTGEFEAGFKKTGQTREHALLARSLGASMIVVIVNKMDTCDWSQDRFNYIKENLLPFLEKNCGFDQNAIFWTCIEGISGLNIKDPVDLKEASWYEGTTLFKTLDSLPKVKRSEKKMIRIPVLSKIQLSGDLEIFGKIESGVVVPGMECMLIPQQEKITIINIQNHNDEKMAFASPGENVKLVVKGVEEDSIRRGDIICGTQFWANECQEFVGSIQILELPQETLMSNGFVFMLHIHTVMIEAEILFIVEKQVTDQNNHTTVIKRPKFINSYENATVVIRTEKPICLEKYEDFHSLGEFAIRFGLYTVGTGQVLKFKPINKELLKNNYYFKQSEQLN